MKKKIAIGVIAIICCIAVFYLFNYFSTIDISDKSSMFEEIINRHPDKYSDVALFDIIDAQYNKNEYFVLYQYEDEPYSLAIFEKASIGNKNRYRFAGGSSQSSRYGTYKFAQGMDGGYEVLTAVYGDNRFIEADYFVLTFPNGAEIKQEIKNDNFLYIYRFYSTNPSNGDLKFYNN